MTNLVKRENNVRNRLMSPFFEDFFNAPFFRAESSVWPPVDIRDTENELSMAFELPGMKKEDIKVTMERNRLIISGTRQREFDDSDEHWTHREITTGSFQRQFTLPDTINTDSVKAEYKDGVLRLKLAKKEEAKPKQIDVQVK